MPRSSVLLQLHIMHRTLQEERQAVLPKAQRLNALLRHAPVLGGKGGGAVVLGPVELDAPGNPRSGKTHQGRLDNFVIIDEVIPVGFVVGALNATAQLGQHHHANIIILQEHGGIGLIGFFIQDFVHHRQGIHLAAGALVHALFQEHGVLVRLTNAIGGNIDGFYTHARGGGHDGCLLWICRQVCCPLRYLLGAIPWVRRKAAVNMLSEE